MCKKRGSFVHIWIISPNSWIHGIIVLKMKCLNIIKSTFYTNFLYYMVNSTFYKLLITSGLLQTTISNVEELFAWEECEPSPLQHEAYLMDFFESISKPIISPLNKIHNDVVIKGQKISLSFFSMLFAMIPIRDEKFDRTLKILTRSCSFNESKLSGSC